MISLAVMSVNTSGHICHLAAASRVSPSQINDCSCDCHDKKRYLCLKKKEKTASGVSFKHVQTPNNQLGRLLKSEIWTFVSDRSPPRPPGESD